MVRGLVFFVSLTPMFAGNVQLLSLLPNAAVSMAMQLDAAGDIYLAGSFTPASKVFQNTTDAFVAKLSADGSNLIYFTVLAGLNEDAATALTLGSDGSAYVGGNTNSSDFPVTAGALRTTYIGGGQKSGFSSS
jgi:hypothetical protein